MENTLSILNNIFFWVIFATVALALKLCSSQI